VAIRPLIDASPPEPPERQPQATVVELVGERNDETLATLGILSEALEDADSYTAGHGEDVAELSVRVGRRVGLRGAALRALHHAALMHDVGKVGVPAEILLKPAPLTSEERLEMQQHTVIGARILSHSPTLEDIAPLVRATHERWDGEGYPDGLAGEDIPLPARVIAACDAYDAITTDRPYREARTHGDALRELRAGAGCQFDPWVVVELIAELRKHHS
jgi:HD-GYP domain-containing protein (c-di-GMP phosphodiesterase class II)